MHIYTLRHKQNKRKFLHVSQNQGYPTHRLRISVATVPQLIGGKKTIGQLLSLYKQPGCMSLENQQEIKANYELVRVELTFPEIL